MKQILYTAMICCGCFLTSSCVGDLDQFPHTEITSENLYNSAESYYQVLAKLYTAMVTTGQEQVVKTSQATRDLITCAVILIYKKSAPMK